MADGVGITTGSDATVATDDAGAAGQVQIVKLAVSADGSATVIGADADGLDVDPTRLPGTVADGGSLPAVIHVVGGYDGAAAQVLATDNSGILQADLASPLPAGDNNVGKVGLAPQSTGGLSIFRSIDLDETEEQVKGTAGQLFGYYIYNAASAVVYVKLYNATAATVEVGVTTPVMTLPIPALSAANVEFTNGIAFGTAITAAATTGVADADTGAPAANQVIANLLYI